MAGAQFAKLEWGVDKPCTRTTFTWDEIKNHEWPLTTAGPESRDAAPVGASFSREAGKEPVRTTEPGVFMTMENTLPRDASPVEASPSREAGKEPARTAGITQSTPQPHKLASSHKLYVIQGELNGQDRKTLSSAFDVDIGFFEAHEDGKHYQWRAGVGKKAKPPSVTVTYLIPRYSNISGQPQKQYPQAQYFRASTWESAHISLLLLDDNPNSSTQDALMDIINGTVQENAASIATGMVPGAVAQLAHREFLMYLDMATKAGAQLMTHMHWGTEKYEDIAWILGQNLAASRLHGKATRRTRRGIDQGGLEHGGLEAPLVGPPPAYESLDTVGTDDWKELIARLNLMVKLAALHQTDKLLASETSRGKNLQNRVSYLGGFLLPLTIIAGIMSMADPYRPGSNQFWLFWAIAIPAVGLCLTIIHADDIRATEFYRPLEGVDLKKAIPGVKLDDAPKMDVDLPSDETLSASKPAATDKDRNKPWHIKISFALPTLRRWAQSFSQIPLAGCAWKVSQSVDKLISPIQLVVPDSLLPPEWNSTFPPESSCATGMPRVGDAGDDHQPDNSKLEASPTVNVLGTSLLSVGRLNLPPVQPAAGGEPVAGAAGGDHRFDNSKFEASQPVDEPTASIPIEPLQWLKNQEAAGCDAQAVLQRPPTSGEPAVNAGSDHRSDDSKVEASQLGDKPGASERSTQRRRRRLSLNPVGWLLPFQRSAAAGEPEDNEVSGHRPVAPMRQHVPGRIIATPGSPSIVLRIENGEKTYYRRERLGWGGALKVMLGYETLPQA